MDSFSVPAYYRDKATHEIAKSALEKRAQNCLSKAINGQVQQALAEFNWITNLAIRPKLLDDTHFATVSRCHPFFTAARVLDHKKLYDIRYFSNLERWAWAVYLPYCDKLINYPHHSFSNHGAIGLMGKIIALAFLHEYYKAHGQLVMASRCMRDLSSCSRSWKRRVLFSILPFNLLGWNKHEVWVENLRNSKGMYYTGLHLGALLRCHVALRNAGVSCQMRACARLYFAACKYQGYCRNPLSWPYTSPSKIWGIRHLQELIFPSGGETIAPRASGKEGNIIKAFSLFMDLGANGVFVWSSSVERFDWEGPFPKLSDMLDAKLIRLL